MRKKRLYIILFVFLNLFLRSTFAQTKKADSLKLVVKNCITDTCRIYSLQKLALLLKTIDPDTAIVLTTQALGIAKKLYPSSNHALAKCGRLGIAVSEDQLGTFNASKGDLDTALFHLQQSLRSWNELILFDKEAASTAGKSGIAQTTGNIGTVYYYQGNYAMALDFWLKALKLNEEIGDKKSITRFLGNIGNVYQGIEEYDKAISYYTKALKMAEELKDNNAIAKNYCNMGNVYSTRSDAKNTSAEEKSQLLNKSLECHLKALSLIENSGSKREIAGYLGNLGGVYQRQGENIKMDKTKKIRLFKLAKEYHEKAFKLNEEIGEKNGMTRDLNNLGVLNTELKNYSQAEIYLKKALVIANEVGSQAYAEENEFALTQLYEASGQFGPALEHYKKYLALRDSIFSQDNEKKLMRSEMNYEYDKKQAVTEAEHKSELLKQQAVAEEKSHKQNVIMLAVICCLLLVAGFAVFVFRSLRITRKQKIMIDRKNHETELQKHLIEEKQTEIIDSIKYASRIQRALVTSEKYINKN
ncbi:MAG: tetratricopeptide repeat protein, partial [Bacteroidia bacterium]|nr:tetratricopeptide repeat protein [Bacteroidia bacterium]